MNPNGDSVWIDKDGMKVLYRAVERREFGGRSYLVAERYPDYDVTIVVDEETGEAFHDPTFHQPMGQRIER